MIATTVVLMAQLCATLPDAQQLVVVVTEDWNKATADLSTFEKRDGAWQPLVKREPLFVGAKGLAWGEGLVALAARAGELRKREGDRRSPAGVFRLGAAFGTGLPAEIALSREPVEERICVDDPKSRSYGKRMVRTAAKRDWRSAEELASYNQAIVIEHNPAARAGGGSCIFLHDGAAPTPGCSASPSWLMEKLLAWLVPAKCPVIVQLPRREYVARAAGLGLPALPEADKPVCEQAGQLRR